ncbi:MAG: cytochrome C assembly protein [Pirellula sp.]
MPNATCFLVAYGLVLLLELGRWAGLSPQGRARLKKLIIATTFLALLTHSLYLLDRLFLSAVSNSPWRLVTSWHDWGILTAWGLAVAYGVLLLKRSESWIGFFVLPLLLVLVGVSIAIPMAPLGTASSATIWRLVHGVAMMIGTMLVTLGFAMAIMYLIQAWRLKSKRANSGVLRLPSLEYLQSFGSTCLLASAGSIGFGVISGVIMNLVQDGSVNWSDRGIVFSAGLFLWLAVASAVQWHLAKRGRGDFTAWMNILSFMIVAVAIALVVSAPHGMEAPKASPTSRFEPAETGGGAN